MLTYSFDHMGDDCLYIHLYKCIKKDIMEGVLPADTKLPSKRNFAKNLGVSTITVENAYAQLQSEGYIYSLPKKGFYVTKIVTPERDFSLHAGFANTDLLSDSHNAQNFSTDVESFYHPVSHENKYKIDFVSNKTTPDNFPFTTWAKIIRETISEKREALMTTPPCGGIGLLRQAISTHLKQFRNMNVLPEQIIIGAGTEYLYGLLIQLLGYDKVYAIENPGYQKSAAIYQSNRVTCKPILLDTQGIHIADLEASGAHVAHISPSHHYPTGKVTSISRRYELLAWSTKAPDRYILEDDYDSEFRMIGRPIPTLQSIDQSEKVIYINTFSKTLSSTIRLAYMVLPPHLLERFYRQMSFYSCTVSNFEQYTLAHFLQDGSFEKHINRMRTHYKGIRDELLSALKKSPFSSHIHIYEEDAGLHFLMRLDTDVPDEKLLEKARQHGVHLACLSQYYFPGTPDIPEHTLVLNYSGLSLHDIPRAISLLQEFL